MTWWAVRLLGSPGRGGMRMLDDDTWDVAAGGKSLWLLHPCPLRRKRRRTKSFF